jgi:hypothetical protein
MGHDPVGQAQSPQCLAHAQALDRGQQLEERPLLDGSEADQPRDETGPLPLAFQVVQGVELDAVADKRGQLRLIGGGNQQGVGDRAAAQLHRTVGGAEQFAFDPTDHRLHRSGSRKALVTDAVAAV